MGTVRSAAVLTAAAGAALALTVAGCSSSGSSSTASSANAAATSSANAPTSSSANAPATITLVNDSDTNIQQMWEKKLIPEFAKVYPNITLKFSTTSATDETALFARITAAEKAGKPAPVDVFVDDGFIPNAAQAGLLYPITAANVPNAKNIIGVDQGLPGAMAYRGSAVVIAYNSKTVKNPPTTLAGVIAWAKAHPGQFSYCNPSDGGSGSGFVQAVLDQTLSPGTVNGLAASEDTGAQSQWTAGWATLKSLTSDVYQHTYPTSNTAVLNLLSQGQISLASVWSDMFLSGVQDGQIPSYVKAVSIKSPAMPGGPSYIAVPKNAAHIPDILNLFNWLLEPAQQAQIVSDIAGFPAIQQTLLPSDSQSTFGKLNTALEAPFYSSQASDDMVAEWARNVP